MTATSDTKRESVGAPCNEADAVLLEELAGILGVEVGISDNFFDLGGDSLTVVKFTARIKERTNIDISTNDVFDQPDLADLANVVRSKIPNAKSLNNKQNLVVPAYAPFQLLSLDNPKKYIIETISPYLKDHQTSILDVYPATFVQQICLHDAITGQVRPPEVFYMDFPAGSDSDALVKAIKSLIEHVDIFRTVFVSNAGTIYQVVLKHLEVPIDAIKVEDDIDQAIYTLAHGDFQNPLNLNHSLLRVAILKKEESSTVRVVFRMSHALYDALSFKHVLESLHALYNGQILQPSPRFAQYMQLMAHSRKDSYIFWRSALENSALAVFQRSKIPQCQPEMNGMWFIEKFIDAPLKSNSYGITPATIFTTACGQMLATETRLEDVVFGQVVSGRHYLPASCQNIIGPCANFIPIRLRVDNKHSLRELLRNVQDQYLKSLPFETLGFDDMKRNCTDWPDQVSNYGCCTVYQGFDMQPESKIGNQQIRWRQLGLHNDQPVESTKPGTVLTKQAIPMTPLQDLSIVGTAQRAGVALRVFVAGDQRVFTEDRVENILDEIARNIRILNSALQHPPADEKVQG
jgi:acyl carrier protein